MALPDPGEAGKIIQHKDRRDRSGLGDRADEGSALQGIIVLDLHRTVGVQFKKNAPPLWRRTRCLVRLERSGHPPAAPHVSAVVVEVGVQITMRHGLGMGGHIVVERQHDLAAIVMQQLLHFGIHLGPLGLISFGAGRNQKLVERGFFQNVSFQAASAE